MANSRPEWSRVNREPRTYLSPSSVARPANTVVGRYRQGTDEFCQTKQTEQPKGALLLVLSGSSLARAPRWRREPPDARGLPSRGPIQSQLHLATG
jgi:hypothetical protein